MRLERGIGGTEWRELRCFELETELVTKLIHLHICAGGSFQIYCKTCCDVAYSVSRFDAPTKWLKILWDVVVRIL
jgi:hypothetical protein